MLVLVPVLVPVRWRWNVKEVASGSMVRAMSGWLAQFNLTLLCLALAVCCAGACIMIKRAADRKIARMSRRQLEELNDYATRDELTQLANRRLLRLRLEALLATPEQRFMVHYIDIDRFKMVNSLHGYVAGDRLLQQAAGRMRELVGPHDMLGRMNADEFIILQPLPAGAAPDSGLAAAVVRALAVPFQLEEGSFCTGASIGLLHVDTGFGPTLKELGEQADAALTVAKSQGGGQFCLYEPEMSQRRAARRQMESDLGEALAREEMFLHFQPLCDVNGNVRGFEALLRWRHRARGLISPVEFIPFAEHSGHIRAIGLFVLEQACRAAMGWPANLHVAVNISAVQLRDDTLFQSIKTILARTGLPPRRLELEITESTLIEDTARVSALLREMHEFGLELAIDDFGTGYSNLSHLRDFCAGRLKIDRSFISGLRGNSDAASIVSAIAGLGHALGMAVLAEGVETESELRLVRAMGCDEVQGYYLGRPMPEADIAGWLNRPSQPAHPAVAEVVCH